MYDFITMQKILKIGPKDDFSAVILYQAFCPHQHGQNESKLEMFQTFKQFEEAKKRQALSAAFVYAQSETLYWCKKDSDAFSWITSIYRMLE